MVTRRKLLRAGAVLAASSPLAACGTFTRSGPVRQDPSGPLRVWFPGGSGREIALVKEQIVSQFRDTHGTDVEVTYVDWADISPKLAAAMAAGTAPDVYGHGPAATAEYALAGRALPLDQYLGDWSAADRRDVATFLSGGRYAGRQYMIPLTGQGPLLVYRKDLLAANGLSVPRTWLQVRAAARQMSVHGGKKQRAGLLLPTEPTARSQTFTTLLLSAGGTLLDEQGGHARFAGAEGVRALEFFSSLYAGKRPAADQLGAEHNAVPPGQEPLAVGDTAMDLLDGPTLLPMIDARPEIAHRLGVVLPSFSAPDDGRSIPAAFGGAGPGLFINRDSAKRDLAWAFIELMVSRDVSRRYAEAVGAIPLRASVPPSGSAARRRFLRAYIQSGPRYIPNPNVPAWVQVRDVLDRYVEQALLGRLSAQETLDRAAGEVDGLLRASDR